MWDPWAQGGDSFIGRGNAPRCVGPGEKPRTPSSGSDSPAWSDPDERSGMTSGACASTTTEERRVVGLPWAERPTGLQRGEATGKLRREARGEKDFRLMG